MGFDTCCGRAPHSGELDRTELSYDVGALLYAPATNDKIIRFILQQKCGEPYSASLCLEDSISDSSVGAAEENIVTEFREIREALNERPDMYLPHLFIRVRRPEQITDLFQRLAENASLLTGFIAPKYSLANADEYNRAICEINRGADRRFYLMPTLESRDIASFANRQNTLVKLREKIDLISDYILNVRVGGNDFCNAFGVRRDPDETIYDILTVSSILSDILTVFIPDYVVSGPVWEYFDDGCDAWKEGLLRELKLDRLNGFIGKTVIHPKQIPLVNASLRVRRRDLEDAESILNWSADDPELVKKNESGERMNEVRVHTTWAQKICLLAKLYGVKE